MTAGADKIWCELQITPPYGWEEAVSAYLFEVGAGAVEERYSDGGKILISHLPQDESLNERLATLGKHLVHLKELSGSERLPEITLSRIKDRPWAYETRKKFRPVELMEGVRVAPSWRRTREKSGETLLRIDPGEAFGTGLHPSTKLCARLMTEAVEKFDRPGVLDVGTGTGILAMTALAKGAGEVTATDTDPRSLEVAAENFKNNNMAVKLTSTPVERMKKKYHVVTANIFLQELERLAPHLNRLAFPGGYIVLSGLVNAQARDMIECMNALGFRGVESKSRSGQWCALRFKKK